MPEEKEGIFDKVKDAVSDLKDKVTGDDAKGESLIDKAKGAADRVGEKVKDVFSDHGDKIDGAVDKAGGFVDDKTKGKFSEHIEKVQDAAHGAVDKLAGEGGEK
jgi:uncharacterized protein YjbJ (UPF0337 family)